MRRDAPRARVAASRPTPSSVPGRKFSTTTSAVASSRSTTSRPPGGLEVDGDAFLVAVDAQEVGALVAQERRAPAPRVVAAAGMFELDDAGAEVAEHHRAVRPREHAGEIENGDAVQWSHTTSTLWYPRLRRRRGSAKLRSDGSAAARRRLRRRGLTALRKRESVAFTGRRAVHRPQRGRRPHRLRGAPRARIPHGAGDGRGRRGDRRLPARCPGRGDQPANWRLMRARSASRP